MKVPGRKQLILFGILPILLLAAGFSLLMYFSHDEKELLTGFPHRLMSDEGDRVEIRMKRPKGWVPLSSISKYAQSAIVLSEDWSFYQHEGYDEEQIKVAFEEAVSGGRVRGASTITQQMVKNIWLTNDRTIGRKIHELILAYKADKVLSKKRILELYLNVIEFGPGIYGIGKASWHYFSKPPSKLSPRESAFLAMLLPSPKRYYVSFKKKKLTPFARQRVKEILIKMRMGKVISPVEFQEQLVSEFSWESD